ncbi:MAG: NAD(P)-binding protein [Cyanobacteria bacterium P01_E01_bin.6]
MNSHVIVCGLGRTGFKILCLLKEQDAEVVGVNDRPLRGIPSSSSSHFIIGDLRSPQTLIDAGIHNAHTLVLASGDDALNLAILTQARVLNPSIRIVNRLFNTSLGQQIDRTLPDHVSMSVAALAAPVFAFAALGNRAIGQLRLKRQSWPIHEEVIDAHHPWLGRHLHELWESRSRMFIYYLPAQNQTDFISAMYEGRCIELGDRLILATQPNVQSSQQTIAHVIQGVLTSLNHFQQQIRPTIIVLFALLATIVTATLTYVTVNFNVSVVDALYFSVGMITGAGGNEGVAEQSPESIKVFTVIMMLLGTGVIGVCYALLNDLVLGTRFRKMWSTVRVPRRNHYIVCGLGGIGINIVSQLRDNGCDVVVIETDPNNRFLSMVRSLKVPVICGDASLAAILQTAHIQQASALITVTSNDVTNLEIALSAKGLAPKLPVIMRTQDPDFAPLAQEVFAFEAIFSPADLSAPAFAAAALGGRILGNGMTGNALWVAIATIITPGHPFCGRRVKEAAMDADFVPLHIETMHQEIHGWDLLETSLSAGDVLYMTLPAKNLQMLWRSHPTPLAVPLQRL